MQFLVLSRRYTERYEDAEFDAVIPDETRRVRQLYAAGVVRQIWLRDDIPGACFVIEAPDEQAARSTVDALPMAQSGLSEFTVIPLLPYRGFGPR
ncbi:muconolactone Delta-isomerase family protein [Amycolatopsis benzoatilytica]|uniref:muconolactone Delta-isomerase family protein n=1 Tax=Amycolatopsis benzoatilytica TaxID=346045 RepID=UPI0003824A23|nr:muconolactone Delta-isomerase family protein [Amycolatopsis benzoatilytica]